MGKEKRPFCFHQNFVPSVLSAPARRYIHVEKREKMYSGLSAPSGAIYIWLNKAIVFKLATNRQSDKGFLFT